MRFRGEDGEVAAEEEEGVDLGMGGFGLGEMVRGLERWNGWGLEVDRAREWGLGLGRSEEKG